LKQYEEVYKDMTNKNKQQKLTSEYFHKERSLQTMTKTIAKIVEAESNEMILSSVETESY